MLFEIRYFSWVPIRSSSSSWGYQLFGQAIYLICLENIPSKRLVKWGKWHEMHDFRRFVLVLYVNMIEIEEFLLIDCIPILMWLPICCATLVPMSILTTFKLTITHILAVGHQRRIPDSHSRDFGDDICPPQWILPPRQIALLYSDLKQLGLLPLLCCFLLCKMKSRLVYSYYPKQG